MSRLAQTVSTGRLAHAYLFTGTPGVGQLPVALWYAQLILTQSSPEQPFQLQVLTHPDMYFFFPVAATEKVKKNVVSKRFLTDWRSFLSGNPYGDLHDWYRHLGLERKQGKIGVDEACEIVRQLALKPFLSSYRVLMIWQAHKLNNQAANKLLKVLEEPPGNAVFILLSDSPGELLPTLVSRMQRVVFKPLSADAISKALQDEGMGESRANRIAYQAQGSYREALYLSAATNDAAQFEQWFVRWIRSAFKSLKTPRALQELIALAAELSRQSREEQKQFLSFSMLVFRQAFLRHCDLSTLHFLELKSADFKFDSFSTYVKATNIAQILHELNEAFYHIERHVSGKVVFLDLSVKIARLLHS